MTTSQKHQTATPTILESIFIILTFFLVTQNSYLGDLAKKFIGFDNVFQVIIFMLITEVVCLFILYFILRPYLHKLRGYFLNYKILKYAILGVLANFFITFVFKAIILSLVGPGVMKPPLNQKMLSLIITQYPYLMFFSIVIFAPVVEELVFRFAIFKPLSTKNKLLAYLLSSFIFGFLHISTSVMSLHNYKELYYLPVYMTGGLVFAYLYDKTNNLATPIIAHMLNNYIAFIFILCSAYLL